MPSRSPARADGQQSAQRRDELGQLPFAGGSAIDDETPVSAGALPFGRPRGSLKPGRSNSVTSSILSSSYGQRVPIRSFLHQTTHGSHGALLLFLEMPLRRLAPNNGCLSGSCCLSILIMLTNGATQTLCSTPPKACASRPSSLRHGQLARYTALHHPCGRLRQSRSQMYPPELLPLLLCRWEPLGATAIPKRAARHSTRRRP